MSKEPTFRRRIAAIKREGGFTLIEMLVVMTLLGITMAMFAGTFSSITNRSSQVQGQNIGMTEVRGALNQIVNDFRDASYGPKATPIISDPSNHSLFSFYSPDRMQPAHMRRIKYWVQGTSLMRQVTTSTNMDGPPWTGVGSDTGPTSTLFSGITNPTSIFQYCGQNTTEMGLAPTNPTSPQPITWQCTAPTSTSTLNTVVVQVGVATNSASPAYYYGTVATLRSTVNQAQTGASS